MLKHQLKSVEELNPNEAFEIRNAILAKVGEKESLNDQINQQLDSTDLAPVIQTISLEQVQQEIIDENEVIIEYFTAKDLIIALAIGNEKVSVRRIPFTADLQGNIDVYKKSLLEKEATLESYRAFTKASHFLYKNLFEPIIEVFSNSTSSDVLNYTIVADDQLAYLPFEAFTTDPADADIINYWGLPYLCKEVTINYAFSLNILHGNMRKVAEKRNNKILAMSYTAYEENGADYKRMKGNNELPYSGREVKQIEEIFTTSMCDIREEASEEEFKSTAQDYAILHLALHGESDSINQYNSKLLFRVDPESFDDGLLHAYELYNLDLSQNQLAVLSSCETGLGKQIEGEGMFSIARGFAYAGSSSIVMSLWKVNDKSTSILMKSFYENLSVGMEKDQALRLAKISFMNQADELSAHPANWASFISMGNNRPVILSDMSWWLTYILIGMFTLLVGFVLYRYQSKK